MTVIRFDGDSLPAGWTTTEPAGGHVVVSGGYLRLQSDVGADFDNLSGGVTTPQGPLVRIPISGTFDYAFGLGNSAIAAINQSFELTVWDQASTRGIRFGQYSTAAPGRSSLWFCRRQTTTNQNVTLTAPPSNLYGTRGWMRYTWTGTQFILRSSQTGKPGTWHTHGTITDAFVPTELLLGMTAATPDANGREVRHAVFVDMVDQAEDATQPPGETTYNPLHDFDLTGVALPSGLTSEVNASGTVVVADGYARLTTDSNVADSYAWLIGPDNLPLDHGMLMRYRFPQPFVQNVFAAPILRGSGTTDLPGASVVEDKYRPGTGLLTEINGGGSFGDILRFLLAHPVPTGKNFDGAAEFDGFAMVVENLNGEVDGSLGDWIWIRFEAIDGYWRARFWYDGDAEPGSWQYEGGDWTQRGTAWFLSIAHNDSTTGGAQGLSSIDVAELELYEVVTSTVDPIQTGGTSLVTTTSFSIDGSSPTSSVPTGGTGFSTVTAIQADGSSPTPSVPAGGLQIDADILVLLDGSSPTPSVPVGGLSVSTNVTVTLSGSSPTPTVPSGGMEFSSTTTVTADGSAPTPEVPTGGTTLVLVTAGTVDGASPSPTIPTGSVSLSSQLDFNINGQNPSAVAGHWSAQILPSRWKAQVVS